MADADHDTARDALLDLRKPRCGVRTRPLPADLPSIRSSCRPRTAPPRAGR
jgi:hypothetical protein